MSVFRVFCSYSPLSLMSPEPTIQKSGKHRRRLQCTTLLVLLLVLVLSEAVLVLVLATVLTAIEYEYRFAEYRFAEYRFAEYEYDEIRCDERTFIDDRSRLRGLRLPC
jgi:hypothetical protein